MLNVPNKRTIKNLSNRSFHNNRTRNIIAICAIILTSMLFTTLFTTIITYNYSQVQQEFHLRGGYAHATLDRLTEEQMLKLRDHPLIKGSGVSLFFASPISEPFLRDHVEVRYSDDTGAQYYYSYPSTGRMPQSGKELATNTKVLDLLKIPHTLGEKVTFTYPLGDTEVTDTFTLVGIWDEDKIALASQIWLSKDYVQNKLSSASSPPLDEVVGSWELDIMFSNNNGLEKKLNKVITDSGFSTDPASDNYLRHNVHPAYTDAQLSNSKNLLQLALIIVALGLIIGIIGYLIIYNIFQISISRDIHFYGLLKTLGTTAKQLRRIILRQVLLLSLIGIPLGLIIGFLVGNTLTQLLMSNLVYSTTYMTFNPIIPIGSALFSLVTILISCRKPGRIASKVSPLEAIHYTQQDAPKKSLKKSTHGTKIFHMALENIKRSKKKTILVILSLSLSIVLINTTYLITSGFDINKFIAKISITDFTFASTGYFNTTSGVTPLTDTSIAKITSQPGIKAFDVIYLSNSTDLASFTEQEFFQYNKEYLDLDREYLENQLSLKDESGKYKIPVDLYGYSDYSLDKLEVIDGTIDKNTFASGDYIIQFVGTDDYGNPQTDQILKSPGDSVTISYTSELDWDENGKLTHERSNSKTYTLMANVKVPTPMTDRRFGSSPQYVLPTEELIANSENEIPMSVVLDMEKGSMSSMEQFAAKYTTQGENNLNYESKSSYNEMFGNIGRTFFAVGAILSLILALIGILNFINVEITGIYARRTELAMMQSIGMTDKQVKKMLIIEGLFYSVVSLITAAILGILAAVFLIKPLLQSLWFFSFKLTILPIVILIPFFLLPGIIIPIISYKGINKYSLVERLRNI